jgi:hypothetical protein
MEKVDNGWLDGKVTRCSPWSNVVELWLSLEREREMVEGDDEDKLMEDIFYIRRRN